MMMPNCPFCEIVSGNVEAKIVYQDEQITAFHDNQPKAPVHILLVPNEHIESVNAVRPEHEGLLGHLIVVAQKLAKEIELEQRGYRLVINTGKDAGQTVFHLHLHLIGGRHMRFHFE
jgi:histidine triad (HIT) family protein